MRSRRKQLRDARAALDQATTHSQWLVAAQEHDALSGADQWREDDDSPYYDAPSLRLGIEKMRCLREAGDGARLIALLTQHLYRHLGDLGADALYDTALAGTKRVVEDYLDEADRSLRWLAETSIDGLTLESKRQRFINARKVFGCSALLLSGGATWGFHHLGVVKALFQAGLLPHILSGASTGAMIAAGVCARNDAELADMFSNTDRIRLDGLLPRGLWSALKQGTLMDPDRLHEVLRHNVGDVTFAEAHAHSGRALNISVSPTRKRQKPRLLCWMTAPDVLVASAALASSALPLLFPPIELASRAPGEQTVPYLPGERWVDGSLHGDLPKLRLSRLHNVNHFIVSQTNPHILPFVAHRRRRGIRPAVAGIASATLRQQSIWATDLARRMTSPVGGPIGQVTGYAHALASQEYSGDIDIYPQFDAGLLTRIMSNPTRDELGRFIHHGERSVWPQITRIRAQTRLSRTFEQCLKQL
jgi:NTE family protein